jgi:protein-S-isoprenylcysteine O-methyltransferase Ste14
VSQPRAYGLWVLVIINTLVFVLFALSFTRPRSKRDWRSFGAFAAFLVALFTEMYGFPLTLYLLSGWLGSRLPALQPFSHNTGHLWQVLTGMGGNPHLNPLHWLSEVAILGGFILVGISWSVLFKAQQQHTVAATGVYSRLRHPQYLGFIIVMVGFLLQWPTIPTLAMFPVLVWIYVRLARREEREALKEFGEEYAQYARGTPSFWPRIGGRRSSARPAQGAAEGAEARKKPAPPKPN